MLMIPMFLSITTFSSASWSAAFPMEQMKEICNHYNTFPNIVKDKLRFISFNRKVHIVTLEKWKR